MIRTRYAILLTALACLLCAPSLAAQTRPKPVRPFLPLPAETIASLATGLPANVEAALAQDGEVTVFHRNGPNIALCPLPDIKPFLHDGWTASKADTSIETLLVMPLPENLKNNPDTLVKLYNILHRFSSMDGIKYWSESRKEIRVFFVKSRLVQSEHDHKEIPDPVFQTIEPLHKLWAQQEDSSFGNNLYGIEIRPIGTDTLHLRMWNNDQIWYGIIPAIGGKALDTQVSVSLRGDWILFYGEAAFSAPKAFGIADKAQTSFYNRIYALYTWFEKELSKS